MITIEVSGFQSIDHTKVEVEGFTALVGRSNVGKSALIRAVKAAMTNATGTWFVRHGAACTRRAKKTKTCKCQATVRVTMPGLDLVWEKGDAVNSYTVNGSPKSALERGVPEFMASFGLSPLRIGDSAQVLQVADQLAPLFLMTESGASVANVLSDVARLDAVNGATKLVEKDRREATSLRKTREKDVQDLAEKLSAYDGIDNAEARVEAVEARHEVIKSIEVKSTKVDAFMNSLGVLQRGVLHLMGINTVRIPSAESLDAKWTKVQQATGLLDRFQEQGRAVKALSGVEDVQCPNVAGLTQKVEAVAHVESMQARLADIATVLKTAKGLEGLSEPDAAPLEQKREQLGKLSGWVFRLDDLRDWANSTRAALKGETPSPQKIATLSAKKTDVDSLLARRKVLEDSVLALQVEIQAIDNEELALESEIKAMGLKLCPTCARPMHPEEHKEPKNGQIGVHLPD